MVTPRTGRPRGRPRYDFLRDPERFAVAFVDALTTLGTSETDAFKIAAAQLVGLPVAIETVRTAPQARSRGDPERDARQLRSGGCLDRW